MEVVIVKNKQELERLEGIIEKNVGGFYEIGMALMEIQEGKYYHNVMGYETFEEYCRKRWDFSRQHAYRFIDSAKVIENVTDRLQTTPANLEQTRPLTRLSPDQQLIAWQNAVETAPDGKVTASHVYKIVKGMTIADSAAKEKKAIKKGVDVEKVDTGFQAAWDAMLESIKYLRIMKWTTMSKADAIKKVTVLIDILEN